MTKGRLRDELVVEAWHQLNADALGAVELESIRNTLSAEFTERATPSPAAIARILAEQGIRLRHAEVLSADTRWRTLRLNELFAPGELDFQSIESSVESIQRLDDLLVHFNSEGDETGEAYLREFVLTVKAELESTAKARIRLGTLKEVAVEVVEWLTIWLQTPHIFADWLEIRRTSESFRRKFESSTDYTEPDRNAG